jgi:trehalose 6-phosphate synthase/phosphatase
MDAPLSVSLVAEERDREHPRVELRLTPEDLFTTAVGHPTKRTLAKWHVTSPQEVIAELLKLAGVHNDSESDSKL